MKRPRPERRPSPWPVWLLALLALGLAYAFFVLPHQLGERPMRIEFVEGREGGR